VIRTERPSVVIVVWREALLVMKQSDLAQRNGAMRAFYRVHARRLNSQTAPPQVWRWREMTCTVAATISHIQRKATCR
jgi:hypothetical protein